MYAAVEVKKLDKGGLRYICNLLGCPGNTFHRGQEDLQQGDIERGRIRLPGEGGKYSFKKYPDLNQVFLKDNYSHLK